FAGQRKSERKIQTYRIMQWLNSVPTSQSDRLLGGVHHLPPHEWSVRYQTAGDDAFQFQASIIPKKSSKSHLILPNIEQKKNPALKAGFFN
ncbi:MAG: hypothetical protein O2817_11705, partial [Proteobacteria bacterium]|nr:hypothetical protein [Pseudomonadota bacterium]